MEQGRIAGQGLRKQLRSEQRDGGRRMPVQVGHLARAYAVGHLLGVSRRSVDGGQAFHCVGDMGVYVGEKQRDAVAALAEFTLGAGVDGRHDTQWHIRQLALGRQVFAHGTGGYRQHGVVDGGARHRLADALDVLQRITLEREHAVR